MYLCICICVREEKKSIRLLYAKSRITILKFNHSTSARTLWSCTFGATILQVILALNLVFIKTIFWIKTLLHLLKTYVANRVAIIQDNIGTNERRYINQTSRCEIERSIALCLSSKSYMVQRTSAIRPK